MNKGFLYFCFTFWLFFKISCSEVVTIFYNSIHNFYVEFFLRGCKRFRSSLSIHRVKCFFFQLELNPNTQCSFPVLAENPNHQVFGYANSSLFRTECSRWIRDILKSYYGFLFGAIHFSTIRMMEKNAWPQKAKPHY